MVALAPKVPVSLTAAGLGILTTLGSCRHAHTQAAILGRCLALRFPETPKAVVGNLSDISGLQHFGWSLLASSDLRLRSGFESKLCLNEHSPFAETLFLDSDILPVQCGVQALNEFLGPLRACAAPVAYYATRYQSGESFQGTPIAPLQARLGIGGIYGSHGGGHYYWRKGPPADAIFARAREIAAESWPEILRFNEALSGAVRVPDEVVIAITLALQVPDAQLPSGDAVIRSYRFTPSSAATFVHFLADYNPLLYYRMTTSILGERRAPALASFWYLERILRKGLMRLRRGGWTWHHVRRLVPLDQSGDSV